MVRNIDEIQKLGKDNMDATLKSFGALSKSLQAITVEIADYSKKVFEQNTAATERLIGAKSLEKAIEVQTDYAKSSYASFVFERSLRGRVDQVRRRNGALKAPGDDRRRRSSWVLEA